jgi:ABC-type lipoprotein release transport system permease subunit
VGRLLLIGRLAARDLRRRRVEATLMLLVITAATATLSLGLVLTGATSSPYQRTRALTGGPDVSAQSAGASRDGAPPASLTALSRASGVTGHSGPFPVVSPVLRAGGHLVPGDDGFQAEGRDQAAAAIDQPKVIQGTWVRPGGAVLTPSYATELDVRPGDRITLAGRPFRVVGLAVTAAWPTVNSPGLMWLTRADALRLAGPGDPLSYALSLRLARPAAATAWVSARSTSSLFLMSWQQISSQDDRGVQIEQTELVVCAWLLSLLAIASVAVVAGGRMAEQSRRVGLLKAVGAAPRMVAAVLLAEHLAVALLAAAAGLGLGWLAAPLVGIPADGLLGSPGTPSITPLTVGVVTALALAVALLATFVPALRAARVSTVAALADTARPPRRRAWLIRVSRRMPAPLLLGLRLAARRPRRLVLGAVSTMITVATVIGVLVVADRRGAGRVPGGLTNPVDTEVQRILLVVAAGLVVLAAVNAVFIAWATAADARRPLAVARSLGLTQDQVSAGVCAAQLLSALPGALLGIPAGVGLVMAASHGPARGTLPPAWQLAAVVAGTLLVLLALTAGPARISARRPTAEILQSETP